MKKEIYLDYSATTYVDHRVKKAMEPYFITEFANPGSFHTAGLRAKKAMNQSRETIAKVLNARPREIIFTASGTESINLAIKGAARANKSKGKHIITSTVEHHAVLDTCEYLEKEERNVEQGEYEKGWDGENSLGGSSSVASMNTGKGMGYASNKIFKKRNHKR